MSINRVFIVGFLGGAPELRYTSNGKAVCSFSVSTHRRMADAEVTDWHRVVCWERAAERCAASLSKGTLVAVDGRLIYERYEDSRGEQRRSCRIVATTVRDWSGERSAVLNVASKENVPQRAAGRSEPRAFDAPTVPTTQTTMLTNL